MKEKREKTNAKKCWWLLSLGGEHIECLVLFLNLFCEFKIMMKMEVLKSRTEISCLKLFQCDNAPRGWNWAEGGGSSLHVRGWGRRFAVSLKRAWTTQWEELELRSQKCLSLQNYKETPSPWGCLSISLAPQQFTEFFASLFSFSLSFLCMFMCVHVCMKVYMCRGQRPILSVFLNCPLPDFWDWVSHWA